MTEKLTPEQQYFQDLSIGFTNQRNAAQNECVQLAAQVATRDREIAELKAKIATLEAQAKSQAQGALPLPLPERKKTNGKHAEATQ